MKSVVVSQGLSSDRRGRDFGRALALVSAACIALVFGGCAGGIPADVGSEPSRAAGQLDASELLWSNLITNHPSESLPIVRLNSNDQLTLQFDMLGDVGRPWAIRFLPATIDWEPSYEPEPETMPSPDDIFDYDTSNTNDFPYVHYTYTFPNARASFYRSGNYILEVYDGSSDQTLFTRRFCIVDDEVPVDLSSGSWSLITDQPDELRPEARIDIPTDPWVTPDGVEVHFIKNGWMSPVLSADDPRIEGTTYIYMPRDMFPLTRPVFSVDLGDPGSVHRRDDIPIPTVLDLFPDDFRFFRERFPNTAPIPRISSPSHDPNRELVTARFTLIHAPHGETPYLTGSFNDWRREERYRMRWDPQDRIYFLDALLLTQQHFYAYWMSEEADVPTSKFEGPTEVNFTAFVYAKDTRYPTHRLWAVASNTVPD